MEGWGGGRSPPKLENVNNFIKKPKLHYPKFNKFSKIWRKFFAYLFRNKKINRIFYHCSGFGAKPPDTRSF